MDLGDPVDMLFHPHENPFQSRRRGFDPLEVPGAQDVRANQFIYAFQMK